MMSHAHKHGAGLPSVGAGFDRDGSTFARLMYETTL